MEVKEVNCLICSRDRGPSSHVIGDPRERSSDEFLGPLCELYNFSKSEVPNSSEISCCGPCSETLKRLDSILQALKTLQEQLRDVKRELDKTFLESSQKESTLKDIVTFQEILIDRIRSSSNAEIIEIKSEIDFDDNQNVGSEFKAEGMPDNIQDNLDGFADPNQPGSDTDDDTSNLPSSAHCKFDIDDSPEGNVESLPQTPKIPSKAIIILRRLPINPAETQVISLQSSLIQSFIKQEILPLKSLRSCLQQPGPSRVTSEQTQCHFCGAFMKSERGLISHFFSKHKRRNKGVRKCNKCFSIFPNLLQLNHHMRIHNSFLFCPKDRCNKSFPSETTLNSHIQESHKKPSETHPCTDCPMVFNSYTSLISHSILKHPKLPTLSKHCPISSCGSKFKTQLELRFHLKQIHPKERRSLVCKFCDKRFSNKGLKKGHISRFHSKLSREYHCELCGKDFTTKKNLRSHKYYVHSIARNILPGMTFICNIDGCSKSFPNNARLNIHRKEHSKTLSCTQCSKKFAFHYKLKKHEEEAHSDATPYNCSQCSAGFKTNQHLKDHITRIHLKLTFPCSDCKQIFELEKRLKDHKCAKRNPNALTCPIEDCNMQFNTFAYLKAHSESNHPDLNEPVKRPSFPCSEACGNPKCIKVFRLERNLRVHLKEKLEQDKKKVEIHLCQHCGKNYKTKAYLSTHISKSHRKICNLLCQTCGKGFYTIARLRKHEIVHLDPEARKVLTEKSKAPCHICGKILVGLTSMRNHIKYKHRKLKPFICEDGGCGKAFINNCARNEHYAIHINPKRTEYDPEFAEKAPQSLHEFLGRRKIARDKYSQKKKAN